MTKDHGRDRDRKHPSLLAVASFFIGRLRWQPHALLPSPFFEVAFLFAIALLRVCLQKLYDAKLINQYI